MGWSNLQEDTGTTWPLACLRSAHIALPHVGWTVLISTLVLISSRSSSKPQHRLQDLALQHAGGLTKCGEGSPKGVAGTQDPCWLLSARQPPQYGTDVLLGDVRVSHSTELLQKSCKRHYSKDIGVLGFRFRVWPTRVEERIGNTGQSTIRDKWVTVSSSCHTPHIL
jgi:hypothetical protein